MKKLYSQPEIRTISASEVLESLGPASAYATDGGSYTPPVNPNPWGSGVDPNNPLG